MKKFICLLFCCIIFWQVFPLSVFAKSDQVYYGKADYTVSYKSTKEIPTRSPSFDVAKLEELLYEGFYLCLPAIDISSLGIKPTSENINVISNLIYYEMPECFHISRYEYSYNSTSIIEIRPQYSYSAIQYQAMHAELIGVKAELLKGIKENNNLDDVEKALLLHDRLAMICQYDYSYSELGYTTYGAMVNGAAVCQGYTEAYKYLLDEAGIESKYCDSDALYHIWNIVYIDDIPYHVDVTWDDYAWGNGERGAAGTVVHYNFLRSSNGIYATGHNASDYDTSPNDTTYDNYFWQNSSAAFQLIDDELYYINNSTANLKRYSDHKNITSVSSNWWYYGNQSRLSGDGKYLYYSLSDAVYQYDVSKGISTNIFSPDISGNDKIYGFAYLDGYLICDIADAPPYDTNRSNLYQITQKYEASIIGTVVRWNIALDNEITVKFYLDVDSSLITTTSVKITVADNVVITNIEDLNKVNGLYEIPVEVAAAQMNDVIYVEFISLEGVSEKYSYSVRQYCDAILENSSQSVYHALVKELLNYGAMAQMYFNYNTSNLANNGITGTASNDVPSSAKALSVNGNIDGCFFYGVSLVYKDQIAVRYYFYGDVSGCTFKVNGTSYKPIAKDQMYFVEISDVLPQDLDKQITLTVTNAQGNTLSVTYGPMNYIVRMNQAGDEITKKLMKALYNYHLAAKKFV